MTRQRGFTLLEVLVAFSILALSLGVLMRIFSGNLRNTLETDHYQAAADLAESLLVRAGREWPLDALPPEGETAGMRWRLEAGPAPLEEGLAEVPGLDLYDLKVRVTWEQDRKPRSFTLTSRRLVSGFRRGR